MAWVLEMYVHSFVGMTPCQPLPLTQTDDWRRKLKSEPRIRDWRLWLSGLWLWLLGAAHEGLCWVKENPLLAGSRVKTLSAETQMIPMIPSPCKTYQFEALLSLTLSSPKARPPTGYCSDFANLQPHRGTCAHPCNACNTLQIVPLSKTLFSLLPTQPPGFTSRCSATSSSAPFSSQNWQCSDGGDARCEAY